MGFKWVIPRLAQGSVPTGPLHRDFHAVVLCAGELQDLPALGVDLGDVEVLKAPLDDAEPTLREIHIAYDAAREVTRRWRLGQCVLVTCHQGRNRSGLVTGLTLMMLGATDKQAIEVVRAARKNALTNRHFVQVLADAQTRRAQKRAA